MAEKPNPFESLKSLMSRGAFTFQSNNPECGYCLSVRFSLCMIKNCPCGQRPKMGLMITDHETKFFAFYDGTLKAGRFEQSFEYVLNVLEANSLTSNAYPEAFKQRLPHFTTAMLAHGGDRDRCAEVLRQSLRIN